MLSPNGYSALILLASSAAVGVAAGTLYAVLIARSFVQGTPGVETTASLERFRPVLADAPAVPGGC